MSEIRWTDKIYLDSQGNIRSLDGCPTDQMTQDLITKVMTNIGCAKPQGEWTIGYSAKQKKVAVCNLCNCISFQGKTNFCHNCGAKMKKGGDDNAKQ